MTPVDKRSRSWIEIDSTTFSQNIALIKSAFGTDFRQTLSLQANAFGHDLTIMAHLAQAHPDIATVYVSNHSCKIKLQRDGFTKNMVVRNSILDDKYEDNRSGLSGETMHTPSPDVEAAHYGFSNRIPELKPFLSWKSTISRLKKIDPFSSIGYARSFVAKRSTIIGILPIGYADGFPRSLSNHAHVVVRGQNAPLIGLVSMNLIAIDVTDIEGTARGDEVTIVGPNTIETLSNSARCSSTELTSRMHQGIPRIILPHAFDKIPVLPHQQTEYFF